MDPAAPLGEGATGLSVRVSLKCTLAVLERYPELKSEIPNEFLQHKIPKVNAEDLSPATCPENPHLEWCPPGHGDIYAALVTSNILDRLLATGYEYAFVSNADNLGAILGHIVRSFDPCLVCTVHTLRKNKPDGSFTFGF